MGEGFFFFFFFLKKVPHWFPSVVFPRDLTQALRTKSSDTNCCILGTGEDMYEEEKILLLLLSFLSHQ